MPRATRARTRGALKEKTGTEDNVRASGVAAKDVAILSPKAAVGRGGAAAASAAHSGVDEAAAEARKRELERELADLKAERM